MNTGTGITLFPLQIKMDPDGIEFTHICGGIGYVLTPKELPVPLWTRLCPLVSSLFEGEIRLFELTPNQTPQYRFVPQGNDALKELSEETEETLALTAWWMEWGQRKKVSLKREGWACLECERYVLRSEGRCPDTNCPSRKILLKITGESTLKLVPPVTTPIAPPPKLKKTGTNHR